MSIETIRFSSIYKRVRYAYIEVRRKRPAGQESEKITIKMNDLKKQDDVQNDLKARPPARKRSARRTAVRSGRPPKELAGEVEERIIDAARKVFLQRGFEGASIDEIATLARAGKPTIYARFRDKRALFTAMMTREILARIEQFKIDVPTEGSIEERLTGAGIGVLRWVLHGDRVALMRLAIAEVHRFPELASSVSRSAHDLSTEAGARALHEIAQGDELATKPAFAPQRLPTTARSFLDLVVRPILLRALYEEKPEAMLPEIGPRVASSVAFFLAACRSDGVE